MTRKKLNLEAKQDYSTLSKISLKGGVLNVLSQVILFLVQMLTLSFMARLLMPEDFGVVAMASSITGFILIFKDLGLSMATIQREDINEQQVSNLFWINILIGTALSIVVILVAPYVASFFSEQSIVEILYVSTAGLIIGSLTIQHQALLRRAMNFRSLAIIDVSSKTIGSIVALLIAFQFKTFWALVLLPIISSLLYLLGILIAMPWRPLLYKRRSSIQDLVHFGKNMTVYGVVNYFSRTGDNIIIGKFAGAVDLGFYSRAYSLMMLPIAQIVAPLTSVVVPTLSRMQNNAEDFRKYYINLMKLLAYVSFPLIATLGIMGNDIIYIVLGEGWARASIIYQILCIAAFWQPILNSTGWILTALGQTKRLLHWGLINSVLLILTFIVGVVWGVMGLSSAYALYYWLIFIPYFRFVTLYTPIKMIDLFKSIKNPFLYTIMLSLIVYYINYNLDIGIFYRLISSFFVFSIFWFILYLYDLNFRNGLQAIIRSYRN